MAAETSFTLNLPQELHDEFVSEAVALDRPAEQVVLELMEQFVAERRASSKEYDAWFRAEVEQALREAEDPNVELIPNEQVIAELKEFEREVLESMGSKPV